MRVNIEKTLSNLYSNLNFRDFCECEKLRHSYQHNSLLKYGLLRNATKYGSRDSQDLLGGSLCNEFTAPVAASDPGR